MEAHLEPPECHDGIGAHRPTIVREILHFALFPAIPHFWLYSIAKKNKFAENLNVFQRHEDILPAEVVQKLTQRASTIVGYIATIERGATLCKMYLFGFSARINRCQPHSGPSKWQKRVYVRGKSAKKRRTSDIFFNSC